MRRAILLAAWIAAAVAVDDSERARRTSMMPPTQLVELGGYSMGLTLEERLKFGQIVVQGEGPPDDVTTTAATTTAASKPDPNPCNWELPEVEGEPTKPVLWCKSWFDGCNTCSCTTGGMSQCTQMACFAYAPAYCAEPGLPPAPPPITIRPWPEPGGDADVPSWFVANELILDVNEYLCGCGPPRVSFTGCSSCREPSPFFYPGQEPSVIPRAGEKWYASGCVTEDGELRLSRLDPGGDFFQYYGQANAKLMPPGTSKRTGYERKHHGTNPVFTEQWETALKGVAAETGCTAKKPAECQTEKLDAGWRKCRTERSGVELLAMVEASMALAVPNANMLEEFLKDSKEIGDEVEDLYRSGWDYRKLAAQAQVAYEAYEALTEGPQDGKAQQAKAEQQTKYNALTEQLQGKLVVEEARFSKWAATFLEFEGADPASHDHPACRAAKLIDVMADVMRPYAPSSPACKTDADCCAAVGVYGYGDAAVSGTAKCVKNTYNDGMMCKVVTGTSPDERTFNNRAVAAGCCDTTLQPGREVKEARDGMLTGREVVQKALDDGFAELYKGGGYSRTESKIAPIQFVKGRIEVMLTYANATFPKAPAPPKCPPPAPPCPPPAPIPGTKWVPGPEFDENNCPTSSCVGDYVCTSGDENEQFLGCGPSCQRDCGTDENDASCMRDSCNRGCFCNEGFTRLEKGGYCVQKAFCDAEPGEPCPKAAESARCLGLRCQPSPDDSCVLDTTLVWGKLGECCPKICTYVNCTRPELKAGDVCYSEVGAGVSRELECPASAPLCLNRDLSTSDKVCYLLKDYTTFATTAVVTPTDPTTTTGAKSTEMKTAPTAPPVATTTAPPEITKRTNDGTTAGTTSATTVVSTAAPTTVATSPTSSPGNGNGKSDKSSSKKGTSSGGGGSTVTVVAVVVGLLVIGAVVAAVVVLKRAGGATPGSAAAGSGPGYENPHYDTSGGGGAAMSFANPLVAEHSEA